MFTKIIYRQLEDLALYEFQHVSETRHKFLNNTACCEAHQRRHNYGSKAVVCTTSHCAVSESSSNSKVGGEVQLQQEVCAALRDKGPAGVIPIT